MPDLSPYVWLTPLLPLLAAAWIGITYAVAGNRGEAGERQTAWVAQLAALLSLLLMLGIDATSLINGAAPGQVRVADWLSSGEYTVHLSFTLDALGLGMATLVAAIALVTLRFSVNYMHREAGFQRFFMILSLFTSAMLLIVMGGNAAMVFIGWELAGVSSYLLIGYALDRPTATTNATRAFVTNRIGDAGFVLSLFLALYWSGDLEWPALLATAPELPTLAVGLLVSGFLIAALAKSGVVPFAPWIARALEGPTPSSSVFYGSLMVHAGVYLIIRLQPLFEQVPLMMLMLLLFGLITALYGYLVSLVQTDVKSTLMFSTTAQVGLMFMECGLGWFELAAWHLAAHAIWRAYQFLSSPAHMHLMSRPTRPVPEWLARQGWLYSALRNRLWLDPLGDWLLTRPTTALARETQVFEDRVIVPLVGLPARTNAVTSLADWESQKRGFSRLAEGDVGQGEGIAGRLMESLANLLHWFEEQLVLKGGGEGLINAIDRVGGHMKRIEELLGQPRYLLLFVMATFAIII
jgi:NADH:ubiquinone oxidoreductase subunit 5 (subunit L)/multisubunit Na+/H+ antiporter MnhA subunit